MSKPFKGVVHVDIRDSTPDWAPFETAKAHEGVHPYASTGGTINRVAVDVSGAPYLDLEREAVALVARVTVAAAPRTHPSAVA